ncbi:antirepressor AbbA [Bacillus timonensis]|nr:antirepressor AbbA [Bacillus timonensis]
MEKELNIVLTDAEKNLLLSVLFRQDYALEIIRSELCDIEVGSKEVDLETYREMIVLYDKLISS